eukprot:TRINITY_DN6303_c0_g2_i1.p1 TRINITY_DN6303_c0_g2~~TRINITY_DN6303_c0_g2_i1.p1  ORF type:complete len:253 (+),score=78.47 TRINITY_DN6303_c0_g2_i1:82-759(+)
MRLAVFMLSFAVPVAAGPVLVQKPTALTPESQADDAEAVATRIAAAASLAVEVAKPAEQKVYAAKDVTGKEQKAEPKEEKENKAEKVKSKVSKEDDKPAKVQKTDAKPKDGKNASSPLPFSDLEPFGREEKAQQLTEASIKESNKMVDQIEKAEVAETKRSVFRALTRLRGAAVASFDGVANAQVGNIDTYAKEHQYRDQHDVKHLADEEDDVETWAFPSNADFL